MEKKIITEFVNPPIPWRGDDWSAVRDGYEPGNPIGRGKTETEAVTDLIASEDAGAMDCTCGGNSLHLRTALAKALFEIERNPKIKDQAWFDFEGKAQRIIDAMPKS